MLGPFAYLISAFAGILVGLAASTLFLCRRKSWYFILWLPIMLWSLVGTLAFLSGIGLLFAVSNESGEAAGFGGFAAIGVMGQTILFVLGLIFCCIARPRKENLRPDFIGVAILACILLLAIVAWQKRHHESVHGISLSQSPLIYYGKVVDESNQPISSVLVSYTITAINESGEEVHNAGTVTNDARGIFKIDGVNGIGLTLQISHPNYYPYSENSTGFDKRSLPRKGYFSDSEEKAELFRMHTKR